MSTANQTPLRKIKAHRDNSSRGVALVITLLILTLMVAMTLAMTIAVTSDTLINKYYQNFRSSFYAADSGVNIARQYMMNQLSANAIANGTQFASTSAPPLSATDSTTTLANVLAQYGSSAAAANKKINAGQGASSWPGSFYLVSSQSNTLGTTIGAPSCTVPVLYRHAHEREAPTIAPRISRPVQAQAAAPSPLPIFRMYFPTPSRPSANPWPANSRWWRMPAPLQ